jgi:hypothetical protein
LKNQVLINEYNESIPIGSIAKIHPNLPDNISSIWVLGKQEGNEHPPFITLCEWNSGVISKTLIVTQLLSLIKIRIDITTGKTL